jgi:hypothetical protein
MDFQGIRAIGFAAFFLFNPHKKARAGFPVAPACYTFYFKNSKSKRVNPPNFEVYISILISGLGGN